MTTASPTPFTASSLGHGRLPRQSRQPVRHAFTSLRGASSSRKHSPLALPHGDGFSADARPLQDFSMGDSSDEDVPKPINFSAWTKALLEDRRPSPPPRAAQAQDQQHPHHLHHHHQPHQKSYHHSSSLSAIEHQSGAGTPSAGKIRVARRSPPPAAQASSEQSPPRVVHLSASKNSSGLRRAASTIEGRSRDSTPHHEYITPAPHPPGRLSDRSRANSESSPGASRSHPDSGHASGGHRAEQGQSDHETRAKSRNGTESIMPNSMRVKRVPGTFLRGAPMRRGIVRRQSEDDQAPLDDDRQPEDLPSQIQQPQDGSHIQAHDFANYRRHDEHHQHEPVHHRRYESEQRCEPAQEALAVGSHDRRHRSSSRAARPSSPPRGLGAHDRKSSMQNMLSLNQPPSQQQQQPIYRVPAPLHGAINNDQENEPPPTFKRNKPLASSVLVASDKSSSSRPNEKAPAPSPKRAPLQQISNNTPLRPAPPPPKMSVLDTATANAGASTVKSKKKRSHVTVNNKVFTIRGRIGKGGSSDVYRVMAENDKMFALKKVNLEDCNEETVRGYKGEIDLLKRLENVDRVVRLFDWEVNESKQALSVLMELGESDLNKLLASRLQPENARLDLNFTRHYWREMLRCVAAVHAHDIVHSDLKPANFLLVTGRLKLIDFGIANAIDVDNTVNVHRETNVGTPNYMSPESLQDTNAAERAHGAPKLMKLGKPSDVWSLGCILYQMVYGRPPFAHIANQWNRVCAIINPAVAVSYPTEGVGGVFVPSSLRRLLQRCLDRDPSKRPTLAHMLGEHEPFLNPDAEGEHCVPMTEAVLGQILLKVVQRCKDPARGFPSDGELLKTYPRGYMDNIRAGLERA